MIPTPVAKPGAKASAVFQIPKGHGGRAPIAPKAPKAPKRTMPKTAVATSTPALTPAESAQGLFRTTLAQIRSLQTPLNTAAVAQPYTDAQTATSQLGTGLAQAVIGTGGQAQAQYDAGRNDAQQHAAAFGITSGAGANPMALQDNGSSLIAQQTQAQAAAASQASSAWQGLLERLKAGAVSKATTDRASQDNQIETSLASNIPGWTHDAENLAFQKQTAKQNNDYLLSTLTEKQREARARIMAQERGQDMTSATATAGQSAQDARLTRTIAAGVEHDRTTQKGLNTRAANVIKKTGNKAGLTQILAVLKPTAGKKVQEPAGWTVSVQTLDPATNEPYGPVQTLPGIKDNRPSQQGMPGAVPKTFRILSSVPAKKTVQGASQGITLAAWNKAVAIAQDQRHMTKAQAQQFIQGLTPRPSK